MRAISAPWPGAVGVSGGSDSLALMLLLSDWAHASGLPPPVVLTVDHGLQADSGERAQMAVRVASSAGLNAHVLVWDGEKPIRNIEASARETRYGLLGRWCRSNNVNTLYVGHTQDDQAETFLLRLARGTGLDGLAAMSPIAAWPVAGYGDLTLARPLLGLGRDQLRSLLTDRGTVWSDDPMNSEARFARTRIREALPALEDAGLTKARIASAASHLARARAALEASVEAVLSRASEPQNGNVALDISAIASVPREVGLRALARLLMQIGGEVYRPRFERLEALFDDLAAGRIRRPRTLHNCLIRPAPRALAIFGPSTVIIAKEAGRTKPGGSKQRKRRGH